MDKRTMNELTDYVRSRIEGMEIGGEREALLKGLVASMEIKYELDVPRWIPVTERLPEVRYFKPSDEDGFGDNPEGWYESDYVLIFAPEYYGNGYGIAQFVIEDNERFFTTEYSESLNCEQVLAWMPLPKPYTEVKSNDNDQ